jgi:uncharacterized protein (DUF1800 family)
MVAPNETPASLRRRLTRRSFVGGALAAGSVAVAYAAVGGSLPRLGGSDLSAVAEADADAIKQESVRINHLLRRAGFGVTKEEHERYQTLGLVKTLDELLDYTSIDDSAALDLANRFPITPDNRGNPALWWLTRMANTKRPLQEKMTLFWHGLLTSQMSVVREPIAMVAQNEFLRAHAFDSFPAILRGITMDPAMMVYLDTAGSQSSAPNENYARELMELFALGEGNYSEDDVREAARAFTGWQVPRNRGDGGVVLGDPVFRPQQFDDGTKTFLGRSGNFYPDDIVDIVADQPAAATYITGRLFSFFIHPDPTEQDLKPFVSVYNENDRNIAAVVAAMLRSDVFYSAKAYRSLVKSPLEYAVGALKALGTQTEIVSYVAGQGLVGGRINGGVLGAMGQVPFEPPNVAGWPGGASWLSSATIFARLNFINSLTNGNEVRRDDRARAGAVLPDDLGTAAQALDYYLPLVLDDNLPAEARQLLLDFAGGAEARLTPELLRGLVYLMLGSPQFHLS